jgi:hypothetical protein
MRPPAFRTQVALEGHDLSTVINGALQRLSLPRGDFVPELVAPEGPSTAGGVRALQRLRLVPRAAGFPTLVVGGANIAERTAELRTFEHVDSIHRARFGEPVPLDREAYEEFLQTAAALFEVAQLRTRLVSAPEELDARRKRQTTGAEKRRRGALALTLVTVVLLLLTAALLFLITRARSSAQPASAPTSRAAD